MPTLLAENLRSGREGLSELLSALILLSVSIAVAFLLVYALPTISPPGVKPWLRPTLIGAFKESPSRIYLYNPHSDYITILEVWSGGAAISFNCSSDCRIEPRTYEVVEISGSPSSVLLRFDTGAWMEVRFD